MSEQKQYKGPDYQAIAEERKRNFISRSVAAMGGAVAGILTGRHLLKESHRNYIAGRLETRDWTGDDIDTVFKNIVNGKADNYTGEVFREDKLDVQAQHWLSERAKGRMPRVPAQHIGDNKAFDAYQHFCQENPSFIEERVQLFKKELAKLAADKQERLNALHERFLSEPATYRAALGNIKDDTGLLGTERNALIDSLIKKSLTNGEHFAEFCSRDKDIHQNFLYFAEQAKKKIVDIPIFDEMRKSGKEAGHMGLGMRHAHDREKIVAFSLVSAVAAAIVVNKAVNKYLHRNDGRNREEDSSSHQADILAQRRAGAAQQQMAGGRG